jgi:hypothetical protein
MYVDYKFVDNLQFQRANDFKREIHRLFVHIEFCVDVKARSYVAFAAINHMKVDVERIIRRWHADVSSEFLND